MLSISLLGLFAGLIQEGMITGLRTVSATNTREQVRAQLAGALERFTREAGLCNDVDNAQDERFQFDADLDGDGSDENNINYVYSSGTLTRSQDGTTVTLLSGITAFDLDYLDSSGTSLATPVAGASEDTIRVVEVTATAANGAESISMASAAYLRNM